jgi:hypothetical protein
MKTPATQAATNGQDAFPLTPSEQAATQAFTSEGLERVVQASPTVPTPILKTIDNAPRTGPPALLDSQHEIRDVCVSTARRALDSYAGACDAADPDQSEACYVAAKAALEDLWGYARWRDRYFRDLLALLEAAVKPRELTDFAPAQREALRRAFEDLPKWILDDRTLEEHIDKFAELDIDITAPIRPASSRRLRLTLEEMD